MLLLASLSLMVCSATPAMAQERLGVEPPRRLGPGEPALPSPPEPPPLSRPELPLLPPPPTERPEQLPVPRLFVRQIQITGNTVFTDEALAALTNPYVNRSVTSEELETLRLDVTRLYVNAGYINSGAILPDQTVSGGVITFHIIEGALTNVIVDGNRWFRTNYLRQRFTLGMEPPLNVGVLQERLQAVQQDDRIARLAAELRPGVRLGESELHVQVVERLPISVALEFNNYQSPSVGAERGLLTVAHRNLTGNGDVFSVTYGYSEGLTLQLDASYTLSLSPRETAISVRYRRNDASVVEEQFAALDITSRSEIFTLTLRHPVYRTLRREFALSFTGERLQSQTFLGGEPFSFVVPESRRAVATDTALRVAAEWLDRTPNQVLALRSRFSVGIDALGATIRDAPEAPDGRFVAWLGQVQWGRRLTAGDIQLLARVDVQLTPEALLPLEQIAIGGRFSVRGYRENQVLRDNGVIASVEAHLPLVRNTAWAEAVQLVPFVDVGQGWNQHRKAEPMTLASVGFGGTLDRLFPRPGAATLTIRGVLGL